MELDGRYELGRELGRGGWATVYEGRDKLLDRPVAIKLLLPQFHHDRAFIERFTQEARIAGRLNHPNIVEVYDVSRCEESCYIVLELLPGGTLMDVLRREAPLPPERVAMIGRQLALALDYAHRNGVVHRDVKPHNVLLTEDGIVKIADFGIARAMAAASSTATGTVWTSVHYAAPEQVTGAGASPSSDLYSLGVVLYEMATGRRPFEADTPMAIALKHVNESPVRPRSLNPGIPPGLEEVILRLLSKEPEQRFHASTGPSPAGLGWQGAAAGVAAALAPSGSAATADSRPGATRTEPIPAPAPVTPHPARRWPAGERAFFYPIGIVATLLLLLAATFFMARREWQQPFSRSSPPPAAVGGADAQAPAASATPLQTANGGAEAAPTEAPASMPAPENASTTVPQPTLSPPSPTAAPPTPAPVVPTAAPPLQPVAGGDLAGATRRVAQEGYAVTDASGYNSSLPLRVLIGGSGGRQLAFLFLGDDYLGTDTLNPSAGIAIAGNDGQTVTLMYQLYRPGESAPAGQAAVRYRWNGSQLSPLDPIPPDDPNAPLSRR